MIIYVLAPIILVVAVSPLVTTVLCSALPQEVAQ